MIFKGIRIVFITREQFELAACGRIMIEMVAKVKGAK